VPIDTVAPACGYGADLWIENAVAEGKAQNTNKPVVVLDTY
jgi:hypothetical protein